MPDETKASLLKQKNDLPALLAMLESEPDWMNVLDTAEALAQLGEPRGLERLIQALGDPDPDVREVAREILTELDDPRGNEALRQPLPADDVFQQPVSKFKLFVSFLNNHRREIARVTLFVAGFAVAALLSSGPPAYILLPLGMLAIPAWLHSDVLQQDYLNVLISPLAVMTVMFGWFVYFLIIRFGVKAKKPAVFVVIYILFLLLLLGNAAGCTLQRELLHKFPLN